MFRITEIELQDWCQHRTFKATFDPNTNGIIGPNGSGKSNLISAIYTGLTGHCLLGNIADNIGNGADKAIVTLRFAQNGTTGVVTRAFTVAPLDRTKVTTTAKLQFGDAKTTGVNAVTAELIKITGFNPKVLRTHIFITQGELESLLFSAGTVDKLKSFLTLLPEIEKTEPLRAQLQNEINQFPEVVMGADIGDLEAKLATENTRLTELTGLAKSCVQTLNDLDIDFIRRQRRDAQTRATLAGSLSGLVAMETAAKLKAQQAQQARDKLVANMPPAVSETEGLEVAAIRQAEVKDAADRERVRQYGLVQEGLAALAVRMESLVPPGDPDPAWQDIASLQKHAIELAVQLEQDAKLEKLLASPGGKCPTCDREFEDHANKLAAVRQRLDANTVGLRQTRQLFETLQALKQKHDRLVKDYDDKVVELTSQHGVMMQRLASTPQVSCLTDAQKAKNKAVIERYDTAKLAYERAASTLRSAETLVTETLNNAATVAASVARVSGEIAAIPEIDTNLLDSAEQLYNETNATLQSIGTEQTVRGATVKSLGADIEKARQQLARIEPARRYRELLAETREVFHRDNLPRAVLQSYIAELNVLCNKFLEVFGNPFSVAIDNQMNVTCLMPGGYNMASERLSGGQACVMSICMRFAINELFAKDLGLLILDEPTAAMDDDNVQYVGNLVEQVHAVGCSTGVQTIIVTHAKELVSSFDHVVNLYR